MSRPISSLEKISVASPCEADWESMRGNERVRFCEHCARSVHDLSAMTRKDALRLVRESEGRLCVRYTKLPDGRVATNPPGGRLHQISRRATRVAAGAFGAALTLTTSAAAHTPAPRGPASFDIAARAQSRAASSALDLVGSGAALAGTIIDPAGAAIPGVAVLITNELTGEKHNAVTNDEGRYQIGGLGAGNYTVNASHAGFRPVTQSGVYLFEGRERHIDFTLQVEAIFSDTMGIIAIAEPEEPLVKAASEDDLGEVKRLLADGADARVRDKPTDSTALDEAVERGNLRMVRALLDAGADARARSKTGLTPLMRLQADGPPEVVRALVERGADVNATDEDGDTPLNLAARNENPAVLRALIDAGAQLDTTNEQGQTALMLAAGAGALENVRVLVAAGADVFQKDEDEKTALAYALENGHEEVAALLRQRGAVE